MRGITLQRTTYSYACQSAWVVDAGLPYPLFYIVETEGRWHARSSLGRGYTHGSLDVPHSIVVRAKSVEEASPKLLKAVAVSLREQSIKLQATAAHLDLEALEVTHV